MNDIITVKSEKGRAIIDYLTRELGLPGLLRSLKVDVSSGVFVVNCQFIATGVGAPTVEMPACDKDGEA